MLKISRLRFSVDQGRDSTPGPWPGPDPLALGRDRSRGAGPWHVHWPWYGGQFVCADVVLNNAIFLVFELGMSQRHSKFKNPKNGIVQNYICIYKLTTICMIIIHHFACDDINICGHYIQYQLQKKRKKSALRVKLPKWDTYNYDVSEIVQFLRIIKKHTYNSKTCIFCFFGLIYVSHFCTYGGMCVHTGYMVVSGVWCYIIYMCIYDQYICMY